MSTPVVTTPRRDRLADLRRSPAGVSIPSPGRKRSFTPRAIHHKFRQEMPSSARKVESTEEAPELPKIEKSSFYSSKSEDRASSANSSFESTSPCVTAVKLSDDSAAKKNKKKKGVKRKSSSCGRKAKRSRDDFNKGVGHGIKKPKKKLKPKHPYRVDKPLQTTKAPTTPTTPKTSTVPKDLYQTPTREGALQMKKNTNWEFKNGQMIFKRTTPVRRSPRKSPRKNYTESPRLVRRTPELFSPSSTGDYLDAASGEQLQKPNIPSPVKFFDHSGSAPEEANISHDVSSIIDGLEDEQPSQDDLAVYITEDEQALIDEKENAGVNHEDPDGILELLANLPTDDVSNSPQKLAPIFGKNAKHGIPSSPRKAKSPRKKFGAAKEGNDGFEQMVLDAGQKRLGHVICTICSGVYQQGDPTDERIHAKNCNSVLEALKVKTSPYAWEERARVREYPDGCVWIIKHSDAKKQVEIRDSVLNVVDRELGSADIGIRKPEQTRVFLYVTDSDTVRSGRMVVGCLVAETIASAFEMDTPTVDDTGHKMPRRSDKQRKIKCGISRLWTFSEYRHKGVASRLVDTMRQNFLPSIQLEMTDFAFSSPTPSGLDFAIRYTGTERFLSYDR